jgi:hypothetical protein
MKKTKRLFYGESNVLSQFSRRARDAASRLWTFDQTLSLKPAGKSRLGRSERALKSSSKRDSSILRSRTL